MQIFNVLLRLYPPEYRRTFAPEMLTVLEESAHEYRQRSWIPYARFVLVESLGLIKGAAAEWIVRFTMGSRVDHAYFPDDADHKEALPAEMMEAQRHVKLILSQMEHAIANHQFEKARFYSEEERKARENLQLLQQKHQTMA
jgi:hypothetical protein